MADHEPALSRTSLLLRKGEIFAEKYRVESFLAEGAMGAVFVGEHVMTAQQVAIKVLWTVKASDEEERRKALQEARIAALIRSEHVVQVIDAGFDAASGWLYIVMELLEGQTLERLIERQGALSPREVVLYLGQVAAGLDRAHNYKAKDGSPQPIIHRDLKPENLFLTARSSGEPMVKILDFGIAKVTSQNATKGTQQPKGTPLYMSPEQLALKPLSAATDVWALGLIAYFLLSGRSYWRAGNEPSADIWALLSEIMGMASPGVSTASERIREFAPVAPWPPAFDGWFARCTAPDPAQRFPSAVSAIQALGASLGVAEETWARATLGSLAGPLSSPSAQEDPGQGEPARVQVSPVLGGTQSALSTTAPSLEVPKKGKAPLLLAGVSAALLSAGLVGALVVGRGKDPIPTPEAAQGPASSAPTAVMSVVPPAASEAPRPAATGTPPAPSASAPEPPARPGAGKRGPVRAPQAPAVRPRKDPYD